MKRFYDWKRWVAVGVTAIILMTDQGIIYAADSSMQPEIFAEEKEELPPEKEQENEEEKPEGLEKEESEENSEEKEEPKESEEKEEPKESEEKEEPKENPEEKEVPEEKEDSEGDSNMTLDGESENKEAEQLPDAKENTEEDTKEDTQPLEESDTWLLEDMVQSFVAEDCLFEQPLIGEEEEEPYLYTKSYGHQLVEEKASSLYQALYATLEEESESISLGTVKTEDAALEGEEYHTFCEEYQTSAWYALDAFLYDCVDAEYLDLPNSKLSVTYQGELSEDGSVNWSAEAVWELSWLENAEESIEATEEIQNVYQTLIELYGQVTEVMEQEADSEPSDGIFARERYARMFQRLCKQAGIECILAKGIVQEEVAVFNLVQMEDENWYLVDVLRDVFLAGLSEESEDSYQMYGDFFNRQQGFFAYPAVSVSDYRTEDADSTIETPEEDSTPSDTLEQSEIPEDKKEITSPEENTSSEALKQEIAPESTVLPEEPLQTTENSLTEIPAQNVMQDNTQPEEQTTEISDNQMSKDAVEEPEKDTETVVLPTNTNEAAQANDYALADNETTEAAMAREVQEKALENISVSAIKLQTYTGRAITPKVTVKDNTTRKTLKVNKQYTISYENNINAGTATAVIRGIEGSGYEGVYRADFTIQPQNIAKKVKAKISGKGFSYTSLPITPGVNISYNKAGLTEGVDYYVDYLNNIEKGTAQVRLTGIGNFTGTKVLKFKITAKNMKDTVVSLSSYSDIYGGEGAMPSVSVSYEGGACREGIDYVIKYPKKLKVGKNTIQIVGRGSFKGSVKAIYTVSKASIEDAEIYFPYAWQYTSKNIKVLPTSVTIDGVPLQPKKDYTIKYQAVGGKKSSSVKKPGAYQIILTGKGNYQGTMVFDFCVTDSQEVLGQNYNSAESTIKKEEVLPDTSPDEVLEVEKDKYWGYYEQYKITSKKGIQGVSDYTEDIKAQHILLNVNLADYISTNERAGFIPYTYRGKTYYFGDLIALKNTIYHLHGWGGEENPYGANQMRTVTLVLLMGWRDELSYLIHPSARKSGAASYYTLNMQDEKARDTFEALFRYMGEELGSLKTRVSNWTLGNEVNSCKEWNYSGNLSLNECVENYAKAFQLLYTGVKRGAKSSRVFISLDHAWTASVAGHSGRDYLDKFAAYMHQTAPQMEWNVNYHPYSQPLTRVSFWKDNSNTTDAQNTKFISMKNIKVLTDYLSEIEARYGKANGSIRVIIGELGYTGKLGKGNSEAEQAAALGYGYYIAMFNTRIDIYMIRAYLDDPREMKDGLYFGLRDQEHRQKEAYDVYKYLDSEESLSYMNRYLPVVGIDGWEQVIPGFRAEALPSEI